MLLRVAAALNHLSPAASPSLDPSWPYLGCPRACTARRSAEGAEAVLLFFWQNNNLCLGQLQFNRVVPRIYCTLQMEIALGWATEVRMLFPFFPAARA